MHQRLRLSAVAGCAVSYLLACGGDASGPEDLPPDAVATVTVTSPASTLVVGDTITVVATLKNSVGTVLTGMTIDWSTTPSSVATVTSGGVVTAVAPGPVTITATSEGHSGAAPITVTIAPVATVTLTAATTTVPVRSQLPITLTIKDANNVVLTGRTVTWQTSDSTLARVDATGSVIATGAGTVQVTASSEGKVGTLTLTVQPGALPIRGLFTQFDRRGFPNGWYPGDAITLFSGTDPNVPSLGVVSIEIGSQLDAMHALGVNTITYELRSADSTFALRTFPTCNVSPATGLLYPQPPAAALDNLVAFFDLAQSKGISIMLRLVNNHMEDLDRTASATWLGSILERVKTHPALELVLFEGDERTLDTNGDGTKDACGGLAEPPLGRGPDRPVAQYVQWAIGYAQSLGLPAKKLSAQAVVGAFVVDMELGAGPTYQDQRQWHPLSVMKTLFDRLNIPEDQRTYAISLYEGPKCLLSAGYPCTDASPADWADETIVRAWGKIGYRTTARMVAVEYGVVTPFPAGWDSPLAIENAVTVMRKYGLAGGSFWRWTNFDATEEADPSLALPIKLRGGTTYTAARDVLVQMYGTP